MLLVLTMQAVAQPTGGRTGLSFLQLAPNARLTALGSRHATLPGTDATLFMQNPALLDSAKNNQLSLSYMPYLADTRFLNLAYAHEFKKMRGTWAAGCLLYTSRCV